MTMRRDGSWGVGLAALIVCFTTMLPASPAWAQAHNPFGVGISEGGGVASGPMGWIMAQQGGFERSIAAAVRATRTDPHAAWMLAGLSFVYGVLHAAGPGHGKAVLASYMVANRQALRRGIVLSFLAALLQATVAIALVVALSFVVHATAAGMRSAASMIERASYAGIALFGAWLVWRKGRAFLAEWGVLRVDNRFEIPTAVPGPVVDLAFAVPVGRIGAGPRGFGASACPDPACRPTSRAAVFACEAVHQHGPACGHFHAPDPAALGDDFSWRAAASTIVAAGARPCSGAILVMVFALAQGVLAAGIGSTLAMALGTALTTAALASIAVVAKDLALRLAGAGSRRGALMARGVEVLAAALVLAVGLSLLAGVGPLQALA